MSSLSLKAGPGDLVAALKGDVLQFEQDFPLESFKAGDFKQHPSITLLTCADSRMPVNIFGEIFNRIFSVENIGNQVRCSEGSVLYGILHLHTPLVIIAGHTDCGAIKAAESNFVDEPAGIRYELSTVKLSLEEALYQTAFQPDQNPDLRFTQLAELNVDSQVKYLLSNRQAANLVDRRELMVLGVMVDLHDVYAGGYGRLYATNVNGENNPEVLKSNTSLGWLGDRVKRLT